MKRTKYILKAVLMITVLALLSVSTFISAATPITLVVAQLEPELLCSNWDMRAGAYYILPNIESKLFFLSEENEVVPDLAESWNVSPDGLTYTIKIRQGVKFHHGTELTSADVKWNYDEVIKVGGPNAAVLKSVKEIKIIDKYTVAFVLSTPNGIFLNSLAAYYGTFILPKDLYEGTDVKKNPYNNKPSGTGPFKFVEWVPGSHILLKANEDYYGGKPKIDQLVFRFMSNIPTVLAALEKGEIHTAQISISFGEIPRLQEVKNLEVVLKPDLNPIWVGFNLRDSKYDDVNVRKAIAHAIDREAIAKIVFKGLSKPENTAWLSNVPWANNSKAMLPEYNIEKAKKLLDNAGFKAGPDGTRFETTITCFIGATLWGMPETAEFIREQLKLIGIKVSVKLLELATWQEVVNKKHDFELCIAGGVRGPDPSDFTAFVADGGSRNAMGYRNERVEELFKLGAIESNKAKRVAIYAELQKIVAEDLPLFNTTQTITPFIHRVEFTGFPWVEEYKSLCQKHYFGLVKPAK